MPSTRSSPWISTGEPQEAQLDPLRLARGRRGRRTRRRISTFLRAVTSALGLERAAARAASSSTSAGSTMHVGVGQLAQLAQLGVGERRLRRPAPAEHDDLLDARLGAAPRSRGRRCRCARAPPRGSASMRATSAATLPLPITTARSQDEVELAVAIVGVAVVPGDELGGRVRAGQVLAGDPERLSVWRRSRRPDDRVVVRGSSSRGDVAADLDVAEEAEGLGPAVFS